MSIKIIDPVMARALQADVARSHPLFAWVITHSLPDYPGAFVARLATDAPTAYVLIGHTLAEVQAQLPPGLERVERQSLRSGSSRGDLVSGELASLGST